MVKIWDGVENCLAHEELFGSNGSPIQPMVWKVQDWSNPKTDQISCSNQRYHGQMVS